MTLKNCGAEVLMLYGYYVQEQNLCYTRNNVRKRGDSNPRHIFICARFPSVCFRPLSHLSILIHNIKNYAAKQLVYMVRHGNSQYC